jgi:serine/threonine-protein kinase PpkA
VKIPGYTIKDRIGVGGQATVYEAVQDSLQRRVALKVLNPEYSGDAAFTRRFLNEGRILANLGHSHVITIHDIGVHGDLHFLSMELVEGGDLKARIREGLQPESVLDYVAIIADCLSTAHGKNVVHRDIKPANVLFRRDGTLLLTDFGIAKRLDGRAEITLAGTTMGSPSYLSPEQAQNLPLDGRADIYSLGAMTFEMFTGRKPYTSDSEFVTIQKHVVAPLPRLPRGLEPYQGLIDGMMAKSPHDRFENAQALLDYLLELSPVLAVGPSSLARAPGVRAAARSLVPVHAAPAEGEFQEKTVVDSEFTTRTDLVPPWRQRVRRRPVLLALVASVLVAAVALGVTRLGGFSEPGRTTNVNLDGSGVIARHTAPPAAAREGAPAPPADRVSAQVNPTGVGTVAPREAPAADRDAVRVPPGEPVAAQASPDGSAEAARPEKLAAGDGDASQGAPEAAPVPPSSDSPDTVKVRELVAEARRAIDELRLTRPQHHSALFYYDQVLVIDPTHDEALGAPRRIAPNCSPSRGSWMLRPQGCGSAVRRRRRRAPRSAARLRRSSTVG